MHVPTSSFEVYYKKHLNIPPCQDITKLINKFDKKIKYVKILTKCSQFVLCLQ